MDLERELLIFVAELDLFVTDVLPYILIGIIAIIGGLVIFRIADITSNIWERKRKRMKQ